MDKEFERWLTGFFEGDGTVLCLHEVSKEGWNHLKPVVRFFQKEKQMLELIRDEVGCGNLYVNERGVCQLNYGGQKRCRPLLEVFSRYVVSSHVCERLNVPLGEMRMGLASIHKPSDEWFAGFWDAEGTSTLGSDVYMNLVIAVDQKERDALDAIQVHFGIGKVTSFVVGNYGTHHRWLVASKADTRSIYRLLMSKARSEVKKVRLEGNMTHSLVAETMRKGGPR